MTKHKNTKRALFTSVLSMLLCATMLIGSTFAWFTDNATTGVNTIQSGTLDVGLQMLVDGEWVDAEGQTLGFVDDEGNILTDILWEPGCSYLLQPFKIINNGNLALKFDVVVSGFTGDAKLAEAIEYGLLLGDVNNLSFVSMGDLNSFDGLFDGIKDSVLLPGEESDTSEDGVTLHMKESAGNEYQGLTLNGLSISIVATQATVESDSYDNQYDTGAQYDELIVVPADNTKLGEAIANIPADKSVTISLPALSENEAYTLPGSSMTNKDVTFTGTKDTVVDLTNAVTATGATVTFEGITVKSADSGTYQGIHHAEKVVYKDCIINGMVFLYSDADFVNCTFNNNNDYCIWTYGNNATFTGCTFNTGGKAILVYNEGTVKATVGVNNCTFNDNNTLDTNKAAIEVGESANGNQATYDIFINGCTVNGFAVNDEGISTNTTVWGNKNSMPADRLNVVIDGVDVY